MKALWIAAALGLLVAGCGRGSVPAPGGAPGSAAAPLSQTRWIPTAGTSYQIQYDGKLDLSNDAQVYDLDMFDTSASVVAQLHKMGKRVMCYISVGTWERWRPDAGKFPKSVLGRKDGHWAGERWLDIRQTKILEPIMSARLALCAKKGFDGVDPDNLDGYQNKTGFPLTYAEQLTYDTWVATAAHADNLTADEKGDNGQVKDLVKVFDFAVVEQCYAQHWCDQFTVYTNQNRLVVDVEYNDQVSQSRFLAKTCPSDKGYNETPILKKLQLTAWIVTCSQ
ncbi:MAG TPA: endo alpha-1,4 polygalactosaminidase [Candidatus Cybelea sp.]|jgi:hypothetical protein|nr:endo alpha-1,4 polygalactosaminidase [Candidatus Cybelea sp.]